MNNYLCKPRTSKKIIRKNPIELVMVIIEIEYSKNIYKLKNNSFMVYFN